MEPHQSRISRSVTPGDRLTNWHEPLAFRIQIVRSLNGVLCDTPTPRCILHSPYLSNRLKVFNNSNIDETMTMTLIMTTTTTTTTAAVMMVPA